MVSLALAVLLAWAQLVPGAAELGPLDGPLSGRFLAHGQEVRFQREAAYTRNSATVTGRVRQMISDLLNRDQAKSAPVAGAVIGLGLFAVGTGFAIFVMVAQSSDDYEDPSQKPRSRREYGATSGGGRSVSASGSQQLRSAGPESRVSAPGSQQVRSAGPEAHQVPALAHQAKGQGPDPFLTATQVPAPPPTATTQAAARPPSRLAKSAKFLEDMEADLDKGGKGYTLEHTSRSISGDSFGAPAAAPAAVGTSARTAPGATGTLAKSSAYLDEMEADLKAKGGAVA